MTAAIDTRKTIEQNGVADEAQSVARQIEHATVYAASKGWTVDESYIFQDDGISGAEFAKRPAGRRSWRVSGLRLRSVYRVRRGRS